MLQAHGTEKVAAEFREGAEDIDKQFRVVSDRWDYAKDVDEDGIGQILEAFKQNKE